MDRAQPDAGVIEILGAELVQARAVENRFGSLADIL
jgi:hypothetical protein